MSLSYGWEKFFLAVTHAATSEKTLQDRLRNAYVYNLMYVAKENVPLEVWNDLQKLKQAVTAKEAVGDEGSAAASTDVMSDEEAGKWLQKVVGMFSDVAQAHGADKEGH